MRNCNTLKVAFLATIVLLFGCGLAQKSDFVETYENVVNKPKQAVWKVIADGLRYREISVDVIDKAQKKQEKDFLMAQIDPRAFILKIYQNQGEPKSIKEIHQETGSLLSFNGSFFDENFRALGLLVSDGKRLHAPSRAKLLNGIFTVGYEGKAKLHLSPPNLNEKNYSFAIQNGPVLIDENGKILIKQENDHVAGRTILALDKEKNIILLVIKQSLLSSENVISLYQLAHLLKENNQFKEFELRAVLNLDGGASTGVAISGNYLPEMNRVQNIVTVFAR